MFVDAPRTKPEFADLMAERFRSSWCILFTCSSFGPPNRHRKSLNKFFLSDRMRFSSCWDLGGDDHLDNGVTVPFGPRILWADVGTEYLPTGSSAGCPWCPAERRSANFRSLRSTALARTLMTLTCPRTTAAPWLPGRIPVCRANRHWKDRDGVCTRPGALWRADGPVRRQ